MFEKKERDCFRNPIRLRHQLLRSLIKKNKIADDILEVKKFIVKKMLCTEKINPPFVTKSWREKFPSGCNPPVLPSAHVALAAKLVAFKKRLPPTWGCDGRQ